MKFAHGFQVAMLLAMMTNITQYVSSKTADRRGSHCHANLPLYLLGVATALMLTQPMSIFVADCWGCDGEFSADQLRRGVVLCSSRRSNGELEPAGCQGYYNMDGTFHSLHADQELVRMRTNTMFPSGCSTRVSVLQWIAALAGALGITTTRFFQLCTFSGVVAMMIGMVLAMKLHSKLQQQWRRLRG